MKHPSVDQLVKQYELEAHLEGLGRVALAFSGGVDSSFLLWEAVKVLGATNVLALTGSSPGLPEREQAAAHAFCKGIGAKQGVFKTCEMRLEAFRENTENRCYICKTMLLLQMRKLLAGRGFSHLCDGSNASDALQRRPGARAVEEQGVESPLAEVGLTKADIRALSRAEGLPTWNKPSFSCLYTRFPYGTRLDLSEIEKVGRIEEFLHELGFSNPRVRSHVGGVARIEVEPGEIEHASSTATRGAIAAVCKSLGFTYTTLDLVGYRPGSMDEVL